MIRRSRGLTIAAVVVCLAVGCASAPYTKRSQFIVVPESYENSLGVDAYRQVLGKEKITHDPRFVDPVREVGQRIAKAADKPDYRWEFNVIDDPKTANAFALPGGKIAVYTGLFPLAQDSAGLAAVLGHEVGHALAHHAGERMSQNLAFQVLATGLSVGLGGQSPETQSAIMQAFGLGAQVGVLLPFSRTQEAEADHIGLILMAKAGYDPHAALDLWKRFSKMEKRSPPEYLSTHPNYDTREQNISSWLPEAMGYYRADPTITVQSLPELGAPSGRGGSTEPH